MRAMMVIGLSTVTLVGCDGAGGDQPARKAAVLPTPRAGLWRESVSRDGHGAGVLSEVQACLDADARSRLSALGDRADKGLCQNHAISRDADGGYHFTTTCDMGPGGRLTSRGLLTGDLANRYRVQTQNDISGASIASMNGHHVVDLEADYLGPCPADMKVGDVMIANGMKTNLRKLGEAAALFGAGG